MLLGARQFFERRGAPPLPYDAEVEYLESTGTQWIDTGIRPNAETVCNIDLMFCDTSTQQFGTGRQGGAWAVLFGFYNGKVSFWGGENQVTKTSSYGVDARVICGFDVANRTYWLGGNPQLNSEITTPTANVQTFALFVRKNSDTSLSNWCKMRIYSAKINGIEGARDLIPVRIGSEGAMYDRVSGQLFRNAGTGDFVIGPDKTSWTNPYVTDGLVAMWDGEWNAGGGVHDADATVWKDLVGGVVATFRRGATVPSGTADSLSWENGAATIRYRVASVSAPSIAYAINSGEYTLEIVGANQMLSHRFYHFGSCWQNSTSFWYWIIRGAQTQSPAYATGFPVEGVRTSVSASCAGGKRTQYTRLRSNGTTGLFTNTVDVDESGIFPDNFLLVGNEASLSYDFSMVGDSCNIRIYSRALTADEIAANYAIDKARFNLP